MNYQEQYALCRCELRECCRSNVRNWGISTERTKPPRLLFLLADIDYCRCIPKATANQMVAAVVNPATRPLSRMMAPAPRKPMPVTIFAAMRAGSFFFGNSGREYCELVFSFHVWPEICSNGIDQRQKTFILRNFFKTMSRFFITN